MIGPTHIKHVAYVKKVTCGQIWKTTKFGLPNKIKSSKLLSKENK